MDQCLFYSKFGQSEDKLERDAVNIPTVTYHCRGNDFELIVT